jgi:hypothetical protein
MPKYTSRHRQELIGSFLKLGNDKKNAGGPSRLAALIWATYLDGMVDGSALPQVQKNGNIPDTKPPEVPEAPVPEPAEDYSRLREFQKQIYGGETHGTADTGTTCHKSNSGECSAS